MALKHRLAKLEKILGRVSACPICKDSAIQGTCFYFEEDDGTLRLDSGTPPEPCPACGKLPKSRGLSTIIYGHAEPGKPFDEILD